jgi:hypothetical protein
VHRYSGARQAGRLMLAVILHPAQLDEHRAGELRNSEAQLTCVSGKICHVFLGSLSVYSA